MNPSKIAIDGMIATYRESVPKTPDGTPRKLEGNNRRRTYT